MQETCVLCGCLYTPLTISHPAKPEQRNSQCCSCWDESCAEKDTLLSVCAPSYVNTVHVSLLGVRVQPCSGLDLGKAELHRSCTSPHSAATTELQNSTREGLLSSCLQGQGHYLTGHSALLSVYLGNDWKEESARSSSVVICLFFFYLSVISW